MNMPFQLRYPPVIRFGNDAISELPLMLRHAGITRAVVCHSQGFANGPCGKKALSLFSGFNPLFLSDLESEAPLHAVEKWILETRNHHADAVIGIGGGAVLDAAKTVAILSPTTLSLEAVFHGREKISGKGHFLAAIPTTAGTGSEMTPNAVLLDSVSKQKQSIRHPEMIPDCAIVDPLLTVGTPSRITAYSGLDALVQAIESFLSKNANPVTECHALEAIKLLLRSLPDAFKSPDDPDCRYHPALGSMFSAMAFPHSGLGAIHALAHPIGGRFALPHGLICAQLLIPILKWNRPICETKLERIAAYCGISSGADGFLERLQSLLRELEIPEKLPVFDDDSIRFILDNCRSNSMTHNPRELTNTHITELLKSLE